VRYRYRISGKADGYFARLEKRHQQRVVAQIHRICVDPYDRNISAPLHGRSDGLRRSRVGGLRILFYVDDEVRVVDVTEIGPRGDVYKS
jgi:mRNA interferase RelE/StbE